MATYAYDDFRIEFEPEHEGRYPVRARSPHGTRVVGEFVVPVGHADLERAVLGVARSLGTTRRATWGSAPAAPDLTTDDDDDGGDDRAAAALDADGPAVASEPDGSSVDVERFGAALADALFAGPVGAAYAGAADAAPPGRGLRLTLALGRTPELLGIPWELLYRRPVFLASQRRTPLVRELIAGRTIDPPTIDDVVRILGVVASPSDLEPLQVDLERERIAEAVAPMTTAGRVQLDWLDPATPRGLQRALRDGNYHIVHFVGHSDVTGEGEGVLFLEDAESATAVAVDGTLLANLLADQQTLRLVVLNSCKGARTSLQDAYAGVATTLVALGVPAVVAMQFEISDDAAVVFAEELYTNLIGRQVAIDAAVAEARKAVLAGIGNGEWATPVLFVQDPDVALFDFRREDQALPPPPDDTIATGFAGRLTTPLRRVIPRRWAGVVAAAAVVVAVVALVAAVVWWPDPPTPTVTPDVVVVQFPSLTEGDSGLVVQAAQLLLRADGATIPASGEIDPPTAAALRSFDDAQGLPVDANLGELTWSHLVPTLRPGARGEEVVAAQLLLNANGAKLVADGEFEDSTREATEAFERSVGLRADGIIDIEVWKQLTAGTPADRTALARVAADSVTSTVASTGPTIAIDQPRPRTTALAAVVSELGVTRIRTVRLDEPGAAGDATNLPGAVDAHPSWSPSTNRLAFDRRFPGSDEIGVYYVVPGISADDRGKASAPLITGRTGTERLPAWSPDGALLYVATSGCAPATDCPDNVRRTTFTVSNDQPLEGPYLGPRSLDTLTIRSDVLAGGPFRAVTALAADPARADSFAVIDADGLWLVAPGGRTLIVPGARGPIAFSGDGLRLLVADPGVPGGRLTVYDRTGEVLATATLSEIEPDDDVVLDAAIPPTGQVSSMSTRTDLGGVAILIDDADDALPGLLVDVGVGGGEIALLRVWALPSAALGNEPATAVAV